MPDDSQHPPIRLAIVGCGAVTELGHLPAVAKAKDVQVITLIDKNRARAESLARQHRIPHAVENVSEIKDKAQAAIVALPNFLHAPVSIELLNAGIHVLVEKPMAPSVAECDAMIQAAERSRAVLAVGLVRRFQRSARFAKAVVESGMLGPIESFDIREGFVFGWPVTSDYLFRKQTAGGGVLADTGAHTLDSLLWWLGDVASLEYFDDDYGGVEADCELRLTMKSGARGIVELSRTRNLRNTAVIVGKHGTLEVGLHTNHMRLTPTSADANSFGEVLAKEQASPAEQTAVDLMAAQLEQWTNAIRGQGAPAVTGAEGRRSVALIEACYKQRKLLTLPWLSVVAGGAR